MFGPRHYVPVLKVKRGEKRALASVGPGLRQRVVPLLEIVERNSDKTLQDHLNTGFKDLPLSLQGYLRCLLDLREIAPDGAAGATMTFARAVNEGINFTPVTGISRTADVAAAVALYQEKGIAIRLTRDEFETGQLAADLTAFMGMHNLVPENVDLIVDLGQLENMITAGIMALTRAFLDDVPDHAQWRTLTVTGSAFPRSMGVVPTDSSANIERSEWLAWKDGLYANRAALVRLPTFSDCAIQHPVGVEGFDPRIMQVSASIRYATNDNWLLIKGRSTRNVRAVDQFPQLATLLVYGPLRNAFAGAPHCDGCKLAQDAANGYSGLGSAEIWRKIGTIHHITAVVQDGLAALQWP